MQAAPGAGPSLLEPGTLDFDSDHHPWQRSLRWSEAPRDRRRFLLGLLAAVLATVLQLVGFGLGMRPYRLHAPPSRPIQVTLIDLVTPLPIPPEPEPPQFVPRPSKIVIAPPQAKTPPPPSRPAEDSDAMRARIGSAGSAAPPPQLFNPDGTIRVGDATPGAPDKPRTEREAALARWSDIQKGHNLLDCTKSRLATGYALDESVGSGIARKYLRWVGLYDPHDTQKRAQRAARGCDPAQ